MNVAIVGSREYGDLERVVDYVYNHTSPDDTIISGGARGVDMAAAITAELANRGLVIHPADWESYGKSAGYKRNETIVGDADRVVAFWDGKSKGTKHSIDLALKMGKDLEVYFL